MVVARQKAGSGQDGSPAKRFLLFGFLCFLVVLPFHRPVITDALGPRLGLPELLFLPAAAMTLMLWRRWPPRSGLVSWAVIAVGFAPSVLGALNPGRAAVQLLVLLYVSAICTVSMIVTDLGRRNDGLKALLMGAACASALGTAGVLLESCSIHTYGLAARYPWMETVARPLGPTESPTMLAIIALGGWTAARVLRTRAGLSRSWWWASSILFAVTLILSQSRVLLAAVAGAGALLWFRRSRAARTRIVGAAMVVLAAGLTVTTLVWRVVPVTAQWPFIDFRPSPYRVCHEIAFRTFADHPLIGVGLENFHIVWPRYYNPSRHDRAFAGGAEQRSGGPLDPHGTVQGYLAEAGVFALLVLAGLILLLWRRRDPQMPEFAAFLVALGVASLSTDILTERSAWALLGLLTGPAAARGASLIGETEGQSAH